MRPAPTHAPGPAREAREARGRAAAPSSSSAGDAAPGALASGPIGELRLEGITKRFPGVVACDGISLAVRCGEPLALVGENGAGKSTLMNILAGLYQPDEGRILLDGEPVHFRSPADAYARGVGMVHQNFMLVPNMTVAENVALGMRSLHDGLRLDLALARRRVAEVAEHHELPVNPDAQVWQLSVGEQQRVELVKTLCLGARLLILDEPTSALTPQETDDLLTRLKRMTAELSIIFISHKLQEVKALSDRVTILRHGAVVFNGHTADHSTAELAALMTGREVTVPRNAGGAATGPPILAVRGLRVRGDRGHLALDGLDLELRAGEILGLAGVSGNGQRELADALAGLRPAEAGTIHLDGQDLTGCGPREVIARGMGYVPEDRHHEGIVPSFSIAENLVLKDFATGRFSRGPLLRLGEIARHARALRERFDIRCSSTGVAAGSLSGGNIQKVILARELARRPRALVAVYPTRGVDLGASEFIHRQLLALREASAGILLVSEELEEILNLADRVAVICKGRILAVLPAREATREQLGLLMAGVARA
ncbi:ABC transporter ATP-binding protein [Anaeromyxobacter diazotrophicus]|uniref:ABC transporter n=1 Tax=Anaeromyxobacter diazotrophicus TaxID=2590199 RepID=A0A7I9VRN0_9BACT|nr:ABC transporter ATP-binding protein [Anaeromyxobacter diazotrophicus]GEJ58918.1 ABC transporter [Anaeromyxobacter diazotrophicus]